MRKRLTLLLGLVALVALADFKPKDITFAWDYPDNSIDAFNLYSATNLTLPLTDWAKVATAPGGTNRTLTLPAVEPGAHFYFLTASNMWGESDPSNVAAVPAPPVSGVLRITGAR